MPRRRRPTEAAPTPRSRKGVATRERLLQGAKAVFEETGFLEARITDIADRAGLSHGSFYHYFDSKEQAFREVAEAQEALLTASDDAGDPEGDLAATDAGEDGEAGAAAGDGSRGSGDSPEAAEGPASEIERIRRANRRYLERYRDNGRIMGVIEEVSRYDSHVNDARMRRQKHFADRAEQAVRRLQADGLADPEVDPEIAALALGSMMGRFAELWLVEEWGDFDFDDAVDQMTRLWANAIGLRDPAATATTAARAATPGGARSPGSGAAKAARSTRSTAGRPDPATPDRDARARKPSGRRGTRSTTSGASKAATTAKASSRRRRAS